MLLIRKKLLPLVKSNMKLFLSVTFVAMIGIGFFSALLDTYSLVSDTLITYVNEYGYPDLVITTELSSQEAMRDALKDVSCVETVNYRCVYDASVRREDDRIIVGRFVTHDEEDAWKLFLIEEGKKKEGIGVNPNYRLVTNNQFSCGDTLSVLLPQGEKEIYLKDFVSTPECLMILRNKFLLFDNTDFGYFYLSSQDFATLFDVPEGVANQVYLYVSSDANQDEVLSEVREKLHAFGVLDAYTYEDSIVNQGIHYNVDPIKTLSYWLPPIYMSSMLIFLYLSITQLIKENRTQIGVLEALGFGMRQITLLFCSYVFCSIAIASVGGIIIGEILTKIIVGIFVDSLVLPVFDAGLNIPVILLLIFLTMLTGEAAALIACGSIAKIKPADAMRNISPTSGEPPFLVRTMFRRVAEIRKIMLSEVLRNKGRFLLSVVCITLATILIFIAGSLKVSEDYMIHNLFEERFLYDAQLYFKESITDDEWENISKMDEVTSLEKTAVYECTLEFNGNEEQVLLNGLKQNSALIKVYDTKFKQMEIPQEGVIIEEELSERMHIAVGDCVEFNGVETVVKGISNQNMLFAQYCSMEEMQRIVGVTEVENSILCTLSSPEDEITLNTKMMEDDNFYSTMFTRLEYESLSINLEMYAAIVYVLLISAVLIGFVIIYNMAMINLSERRQEYSILLVNGFSVGSITRNVLLEALLQYAVGMVISFCLGEHLMKQFFSMMSTTTMAYPYANNWVTYVMLAGIVLLVVLFANLVAMYQLNRFDLADCLKERE